MSEGAGQARLDHIAAELAENHLVVDQVATNEHFDDYVEVLSDDIAESPWPMYIAVIERLPGDELPETAGETAQLLHRQIGEDGIYIVAGHGGHEILTPGISDVSPTDVSLASSEVIREAEGIETGATEAHLLASLAPVVGTDYHSSQARDAIAEATDRVESNPMFQRTEVNLEEVGVGGHARYPGDPDMPTALIVGIAVLVALVVGRIVSWRAAPPETQPDQPEPEKPPEIPELRYARRCLAKIGDMPEIDDDDTAALVSTHWPLIEEHVKAARVLLQTTDMADAVAALHFARRAESAAEHVRAGQAPPWATPCYFDPRHDDATQRVELPGADGFTVPGCSSCARSVGRGDLPWTVQVGPVGRQSPFYTRSDVWSATGWGALDDTVLQRVLAGERGGQIVREVGR